MHALVLGLAILIAWPVLNAALAAYAATVTSRARHRGRRPGQAAPATFWVIIPCLNEERVVERTVRAALALHAPYARTEVLVVDDGSDDRTPEVLAGITDDRLHIMRRELPAARQGKGSALNAAYRWVRDRAVMAGDDPTQVVIGIIDGDGRGSPNLLTEVAAAMRDPSVGAVQAKVRIRNRRQILGMVQDLEFGAVADAYQVLRDRFGSVGLGGNGQFARLSALTRLGEQPWSDCLVEDLELGLRLHLASVRIRYLSHASVVQQGVVNLPRLLRQRTRWAQGNLQCIRYLRQVFSDRRIANHTFLEMAYYLGAPWLNAIGAVFVIGLWAYTAVRLAQGGTLLHGLAVTGMVVGLWLAVMALPGLLWAVVHRLRLRDERLWRCLLGGLAYPALLLLGVVSTWRALGRQLTGRRGWVKTERLVESGTDATVSSALAGAA